MINLKNIAIKAQVSKELWYHIENDISLEECVFRYGSKKYFTLMNEAKALMNEGTNFDNKTKALLETDLGEFGMYEGKEVALDFPMINEADKKKKDPPIGNQNEVVLKHIMFMLETLELNVLKKYHLAQVV